MATGSFLRRKNLGVFIAPKQNGKETRSKVHGLCVSCVTLFTQTNTCIIIIAVMCSEFNMTVRGIIASLADGDSTQWRKIGYKQMKCNIRVIPMDNKINYFSRKRLQCTSIKQCAMNRFYGIWTNCALLMSFKQYIKKKWIYL